MEANSKLTKKWLEDQKGSFFVLDSYKDIVNAVPEEFTYAELMRICSLTGNAYAAADFWNNGGGISTFGSVSSEQGAILISEKRLCQGVLAAAGNARYEGNLRTRAIIVDGDLEVIGDVVSQIVMVSGNLKVDGNLVVNRYYDDLDLIFGYGGVTVKGKLKVSKDVSASKFVNCGFMDIDGNIEAGSFIQSRTDMCVGGSVIQCASLITAGDASVNGEVVARKQVDVGGHLECKVVSCPVVHCLSQSVRKSKGNGDPPLGSFCNMNLK